MKRLAPTRRSRRAPRKQERGVAIVIVVMFLALLLLLGLGGVMTATSELGVSSNTKLAIEAFSVADAGAMHARQLVRNLKGDFSAVLQGPDGKIRTGDEFTNEGWPARDEEAPYTSGVPIRDDKYQIATYADACYEASRVALVPPVQTPDGETDDTATAFKRALVRLDSNHLYELIAYDDARDTRSYLGNNAREIAAEDRAGSGSSTSEERVSRDYNRRILIRSIGYVTQVAVPEFASTPGGLTTTFDPSVDVIASATVDVIVGFNPYPAIITNESLTIGGNAEITGELGGVHTNDDLTFTGTSYTIDQSATWSDKDDSGDNPVAGLAAGFTGRADALVLPDLNPLTYAPNADVLFVDSACSAATKVSLYESLGIWSPQGNSTDPTSSQNFAASAVQISSGTSLAGQLVLEKREGGTYLVYNLGGTVPAGWEVQDTTTRTGGNSSYGFKRASAGSWTDTGSGNVQSNLTYFFLTPVTTIPGSKVALNGTGTEANPTVMTVITNSSVHLNGNFVMRPKLKGLVLPYQPPWALIDLSVLAGMDISLNGGASTNSIDEEGVLYAHEQIDAGGNGLVKGQLIGYDKSLLTPDWPNTLGSLVSANIVSGNFNLVHEVGQGYLGAFGIAAWRELREFKPATAR